jgi:hypothetical protein
MCALRLVLACMFVALPASGHAQAIRGVVMEDGSGDPISGVAIDAIRTDGRISVSVLTDEGGRFFLPVGTPDRYRLRLTHPSYVTTDVQDLRVSRIDTLLVELRMGRTAVPLQPLVVAPPRDARLAGFLERMRRPGGGGQFITQSDIERRPGARTTDLLRQLNGVEVIASGPRRLTNLIRIRGNTRCDPTIYIDGIVVQQYAESGIDDFLRPEMLAGVEIYTSSTGAPPPITARGDCGVIAFWTRGVEQGEAWSWRRILIGGGVLLGLLTLVLLTR